MGKLEGMERDQNKEGAPPELVRALSQSRVGPCGCAGPKRDPGLGLGSSLEGRRDGLGPLRGKFERGSCGRLLEWGRDPRGRGIVERPMSNSEKIALLRQELFADVDELDRSGEIVLPD